MHDLSIITEIRDLAPTDDGWAQYEPTGRACTVCTCGLNTGFVDKAEAGRVFDEHTPKARTPLTAPRMASTRAPAMPASRATVIEMPDLPESITREQARTALEVLGLPGSVTSYELDCGEGLTVGLVAQDEKGRKITVGDGPAIITVQIPFA